MPAIIVTHQNIQAKCECTRFALYDTGCLRDEVEFFQNPGGRPLSKTNVQTAGQLSWPKQFFVQRVLINTPVAGVLRLNIDEKSYLTLSTDIMDQVEGRYTYRVSDDIALPSDEKPLPLSDLANLAFPAIHIPALAHFKVTFEAAYADPNDEREVVVSFDGLLVREIQ